MNSRIEHNTDFQGYTGYHGPLHEQKLGFATIKRRKVFAGENPRHQKRHIHSPSEIGELLNPRPPAFASGQSKSNQSAMELGSLVSLWNRAYLIEKGYKVKDLPDQPKSEKPQKKTGKKYDPPPPEAQLLESWEYLTKHDPEKLREFKEAAMLLHQLHQSERVLSRVEEQFIIKISSHLNERDLVASLAKNLPLAIGNFDFFDRDAGNPAKPKMLAAGMGLELLELGGTYDFVEDAPKAPIPWEIKRNVDENNPNPNDLLQLVIQWLSTFPHWMDRLSIRRIPEFEGRFYSFRTGDIYRVISQNSALTALYGVKLLQWVNEATLLLPKGDAKVKALAQRRREIPDLFEAQFPDRELVIGSRRFDHEACLDQAGRCQRLMLATLNQKKIGSVEQVADPLTDWEIDQILDKVFKAAADWKIKHQKGLAENKIVPGATQRGAAKAQDLKGKKDAEKVEARWAWGRFPAQPALTKPDPRDFDQYRVDLVPVIPGGIRNALGNKARQTDRSPETTQIVDFLSAKYTPLGSFMCPVDFIVGRFFGSDSGLDYRMVMKICGLTKRPSNNELAVLSSAFERDSSGLLLADLAKRIDARAYLLLKTPEEVLMYSLTRKLWRGFNLAEHGEYLKTVINNPDSLKKFGVDLETNSQPEKTQIILEPSDYTQGAVASGYSTYFRDLYLGNRVFAVDLDLVLGRFGHEGIEYQALIELTQSRFNLDTQSYRQAIVERFNRRYRQAQGIIGRDLAQRLNTQAAICLVPPGNPQVWKWLNIYRYSTKSWDHYNIRDGKFKLDKPILPPGHHPPLNN